MGVFPSPPACYVEGIYVLKQNLNLICGLQNDILLSETQPILSTFTTLNLNRH